MNKQIMFNPRLPKGRVRVFYADAYTIPAFVLDGPHVWHPGQDQVWHTWPLQFQGIKGFAIRRTA